jgi:hypothetical protein
LENSPPCTGSPGRHSPQHNQPRVSQCPVSRGISNLFPAWRGSCSPPAQPAQSVPVSRVPGHLKPLPSTTSPECPSVPCPGASQTSSQHSQPGVSRVPCPGASQTSSQVGELLPPAQPARSVPEHAEPLPSTASPECPVSRVPGHLKPLPSLDSCWGVRKQKSVPVSRVPGHLKPLPRLESCWGVRKHNQPRVSQCPVSRGISNLFPAWRAEKLQNSLAMRPFCLGALRTWELQYFAAHSPRNCKIRWQCGHSAWGL